MDFKKLLPHLIAAFALLAVSMVFFAPNAFEGKVLQQPDNDKARGMQTEIQDYLKKGEPSPLWTNSAFGGMPSYQIYVRAETDVLRPVVRAPFLWQDMSKVWSQVFAAMLMAYLLLLVLGADWRIGVFGALAFGITTYNIDIIEAGHSTKMAALALAPGLFAGVLLVARGRYLLGGSIVALLTAMQVYVNHLQITYYSLLLIGIYFLAELVSAIQQKRLANWAIAAAITGAALGLGFATSAAKIWATYEYGQETIRGKSDLGAKEGKGDGLDKDYLFGWSYGVEESMTLLVPHYAGGGANESFKNTDLYRQMPPDSRQGIGGYFYTGDQPFVGTAIYFGAIVFFLFVLGAVVAPGRLKWWLLAGGLFMVSLAWGKNFFLNHILYDYLPMFNKFRAVSMALGPAQLCFALLAALGLQYFFSGEISNALKLRGLYIAFGFTLLLCVWAMFSSASAGLHDAEIGQNNADVLATIQSDRDALRHADGWRSFGFVVAVAVALRLYLRGILKSSLAIALIVLLALADHWSVCTRTISASKYTTARAATAPPAPQKFDQQIKQDKDIHYRVLDLARGGIPTNAVNSYFHKSINGYHAAKLQRFQEVVDKYLSGADLGSNLHILGMMNTKYIVTPKGDVVPNPEAFGHAWFVKSVQLVPDGDAELNALGTLNPRDTAVVQQSFAAQLGGKTTFSADSTARIDLVKYHPDKMEYEYSAATEQLAVFPEQYYPPAKGWKCYLNGQPYDDFVKADFMLRALRVPAGQNQKLEMRFEPQSYLLGSRIGLIASLLVLAGLAGGLYLWWKRGGGGVAPTVALADPEPEVAAKPEPKKKK